MLHFFATASRGTEAVLAAELRELGIERVEELRGGVEFGERLEDGYRACLWSRIASRILLPLTSFEAPDADALYAGVYDVPWTEHLGARETLAVDTAGKNSPAGPPHFVVLKAKDAIVDRIREREGERPNIDAARPDVRVNLHLSGSRVGVSLDLGGRGLHRRGIGRVGAAAPLKENLAAGLLRLAGRGKATATHPLFDPLCGSGTLLIEAAWMALDVAPGLKRRSAAAERWRGHDASLWARLIDEARERKASGESTEVRIAGSDSSRAAVDTARDNLHRAGLGGKIRIEHRELREVMAPWTEPGTLITNPPYGARLGEAGELGPLYELLGDVAKRRFPGWTVWVLSGNPALVKRIGLSPTSRHVVFNGPIECRLLEIPISATPVSSDRGPGWRRPADEARPLATRLRRNLKRLRPWASREGLTCYRLYDADLPEYNLSVDWYDGAARVEEYSRPAKVTAETAERHLRDAMLVVPEILGIDPADVVLRVRRRSEPGRQYEKFNDLGKLREVREGDLRFLVNLSDYLDTGLFLDDRELRRVIRERSAGREFLNLFAYTCAASVAAAAGDARSTTSVDLSRTYLEWGRRNLESNGHDESRNRLFRGDALEWLRRADSRRRYDLIFVAPPTYSRSRGMRAEFDIQRDHVSLLRGAARLLTRDGEILFSTNLRDFQLEPAAAKDLVAREISAEVTPEDFRRRPRLRAWSLKRAH